MLPFLCRGSVKLVCTVHDLIPLIHPEFVPCSLKARLRPLYRLLMRFIARRADRIIAVSDRTRDDIVTHLGIAPGRVVRIYNGFTRRVDAAAAQGVLPFASVLRSRNVVLYAGRWEPYKNTWRGCPAPSAACFRKTTRPCWSSRARRTSAIPG